MIVEVVRIEIKPGEEAAFEDGIRKAEPLFRAAKGCHGMRLRRSVDTPQQYWLLVRWERVEDHTQDFVKTPAFAEFLQLVGACFAAPPQVDHAAEVEIGF